jgi:hypothetical protein
MIVQMCDVLFSKKKHTCDVLNNFVFHVLFGLFIYHDSVFEMDVSLMYEPEPVSAAHQLQEVC